MQAFVHTTARDRRRGWIAQLVGGHGYSDTYSQQCGKWCGGRQGNGGSNQMVTPKTACATSIKFLDQGYMYMYFFLQGCQESAVSTYLTSHLIRSLVLRYFVLFARFELQPCPSTYFLTFIRQDHQQVLFELQIQIYLLTSKSTHPKVYFVLRTQPLAPLVFTFEKECNPGMNFCSTPT